MTRKYLLPALAVFGVLFAVYMVLSTTKKAPKAQAVEEPAKAPYSSYVSGAGLIEPETQNIQVGAEAGGIVTQVFVQVGDHVTKGQALWTEEAGSKRAEVARYQAALESAQATLAKDVAGTRPEELQKQADQVAQAQAQVDDAASQLKLREAAFAEDARAISQDDINQARNTLRQRQAGLQYAKGELARLQNGTWAPDLKIQRASVAEARAQVQQAQVDIDHLTVRAPIDGKIMQVKVHVGEYAPAGQTTDALMLIGNDDVLVVRAQIDENDAWRIQKDEPAVGYPRGQESLEVPLQFERFEPYVIPKKSLTGDSNERVDTRVLEVLYRFHQPTQSHLFVGQQMDVYVKAAPLVARDQAASAKGNR